jgi:hypothetical protein
MDTAKSCPWCSTSIPTGAAACPSCGAAVEGKVTSGVPGVTEIDPTATLGPDQGALPDVIDPITWLRAGDEAPIDREAISRPSPEVEAEIHRMELEAEIANAGGMVMGSTDDVARDAPLPSEEAIAALEAGLIDAPDAELVERAKGLEVDREQRDQ